MNILKTKIKNEWRELKELIGKINPLIMTFFVLSVVAMNLLANKSIIYHSYQEMILMQENLDG